MTAPHRHVISGRRSEVWRVGGWPAPRSAVAFSYEDPNQMPVKLTPNEGLGWQSRVGRLTDESRSARDAVSHGTQGPS
jgi:hypothetical protein